MPCSTLQPGPYREVKISIRRCPEAKRCCRGPAEFLRCATAVIEPGIGARSASQAALVGFGLSKWKDDKSTFSDIGTHARCLPAREMPGAGP